MGIFDRKRADIRGFTIVELIVVIAVIGILASIVLAVYPGYQQRTRDSQRKTDLQQIAGALSAYVLQKNSYVESGSGCGLNGNGNGWLNAGPSDVATYPRPITACLQDVKVLGSGSFMDPLQCTWASGGKCGSLSGVPAQAYMKATCKKGGNAITYVFAHLETAPRSDSAINTLCDSGSVSDFDATSQLWGTNYGMNYYVTVK